MSDASNVQGTRGTRPGRRARLRGVVLALLWVGLAGPTWAQQPIEIEMMVSIASDEAGPIDDRAKRIDERLKKEFRYESLRVVSSKKETVGVDSVMTIALPDGKKAHVRPLSVDDRGALLAVDIEGSVKVDARANSGHLLVFGAGRTADGRLVVSIEPRF